MIVDHAGVVFFPKYREMRVIGRIAFPLFCWCAVVGCCYTRNIFRYALRLLLVGVLSQPCYMYGLNHRWNELNVFFTLLLGVLAVAGIRKNRKGSRIWGPVLAFLIALAVEMDYGWKGVLCILLLYACRKSKGALAAGLAALCLYWGVGTFTLNSFLGVPAVRHIPLLPQANTLLTSMSQVQFWGILALPLILMPTGKRLVLPKPLSYAVYPVHLAAIAVLRRLMGV